MVGKMPSTHPELLERVKRALGKPRSKWNVDDNAAWQEFEQRYRAVFLRLGKRVGMNPEDCEDLAQDVLIELSKRLPQFVYDRSRGPFGGWLMKIARSKLTNEFRRRQQAVPTEQPPSSVIHVGGVDHNAVAPEEAAIAGERFALFTKALRELATDTNPSHFTLFVEVYLKERPGAQVAHEMGIAPATARKIVERMKKKLASAARRHGLDG